MARFRRRFPLRRRRLRRRRRPLIRRRVRKFGKGNLFCKFTQVKSYEIPVNTTSDVSISFVPTEFPEYVSLANNFEYIQFLKVRVRVLPMQSVSNYSTSAVPAYAMLPWHRPQPPGSTITFNQFCSVDKAKIYRQTQVGRQTYIPNTLIYAVRDNQAVTDAEAHQIIWKPKIERAIDSSKLPTIYAGLLAFQTYTQAPVGATTKFNVVLDAYVKCGNQNILIP
ncbi:putative capsid protein [Italian wall lizard associated cyclovirus 1]|nr:putative capsid protein [Italian wall lizard associated cyclovirus 1]